MAILTRTKWLALLAPAMLLAACGDKAEDPNANGGQPGADMVADATARFLEASKVPDSEGTGGYKVVKHVLDTLPDQVVYQPADLAALGDTKMPIYVFGNGACSEDAAGSRHHLIEIASHGYLVIAPGGIYSGPGVEVTAEDWAKHRSKTTWTQLGEAIDWAIAENARADSPFYGKVATDKVAVSGYSCGGVQALKYAGDPRVATFVIMNSGLMPPDVEQVGEMKASKDLLAKLDVPLLYILGGPEDIAYPNGMDDFRRMDRNPAVMLNIDVTHDGTYGDPNGGRAAQAVVHWLDWQLRGDAVAGKWFLGDDCVLCKDADWTVERKNFDKLGA